MRVNIEILLRHYDCVKGLKFKNHQYIGCPFNIVKIYNDYSVDEICITQIDKVKFDDTYINYLSDLSSISRCPLCYSGDIDSIEKIDILFKIGFDKVKITNQANFNLVDYVVQEYGLQSIVLGFDLKRNIFNKYYDTYKNKLSEIKRIINDVECSEYVIKDISYEGKLIGFNKDILLFFEDEIKNKNIIYSGGISSFNDVLSIKKYINNICCGALFTFKGNQKGILANYLTNAQLESLREGWKIEV